MTPSENRKFGSSPTPRPQFFNFVGPRRRKNIHKRTKNGTRKNDNYLIVKMISLTTSTRLPRQTRKNRREEREATGTKSLQLPDKICNRSNPQAKITRFTLTPRAEACSPRDHRTSGNTHIGNACSRHNRGRIRQSSFGPNEAYRITNADTCFRGCCKIPKQEENASN